LKAIYFIFVLLVAAVLAAPAVVSCESIYRWVDKNGVVHFTNVAPPPDAEQIVSSPPASSSPENSEKKDIKATENVKDAPGEEITEDASLESEPAPAADRRFSKETLKKYLTERVEKRQQTIQELENLIRQRPDDESLRKSLNQQRQYLEDDFKALREYRD
jgi:hypothetical protein